MFLIGLLKLLQLSSKPQAVEYLKRFLEIHFLLVCCRELTGLSGLLGIFKHLLYL